jgi:hypothetical protein
VNDVIPAQVRERRHENMASLYCLYRRQSDRPLDPEVARTTTVFGGAKLSGRPIDSRAIVINVVVLLLTLFPRA